MYLSLLGVHVVNTEMDSAYNKMETISSENKSLRETGPFSCAMRDTEMVTIPVCIRNSEFISPRTINLPLLLQDALTCQCTKESGSSTTVPTFLGVSLLLLGREYHWINHGTLRATPLSVSGSNTQKKSISEEMLVLDRAQRLGLFIPVPRCTSKFEESVQLPLAPPIQKSGATCGWYCLHCVPGGIVSLCTQNLSINTYIRQPVMLLGLTSDRLMYYKGKTFTVCSISSFVIVGPFLWPNIVLNVSPRKGL